MNKYTNILTNTPKYLIDSYDKRYLDLGKSLWAINEQLIEAEKRIQFLRILLKISLVFLVVLFSGLFLNFFTAKDFEDRLLCIAAIIVVALAIRLAFSMTTRLYKSAKQESFACRLPLEQFEASIRRLGPRMVGDSVDPYSLTPEAIREKTVSLAGNVLMSEKEFNRERMRPHICVPYLVELGKAIIVSRAQYQEIRQGVLDFNVAQRSTFQDFMLAEARLK